MQAAEANHFSEPKKNSAMGVESKNGMTEEQNNKPTLACVPNQKHCSDDDIEEDPEDDPEKKIYEEAYENPKEVINEELEEVVIYEEFDEDPVDVLDEELEEDPEEDVYEESDQDPKEEVYEELDEEPEEDPEDEVYEESDQDPEEEVHEESDQDPEDVISEEPEGSPQKETDKEPEEDLDEEMDGESKEEELVVENCHPYSSRSGSTDIKDLEHKLNKSFKEEKRKKVVEVKKSESNSNVDTLSELHHSSDMTKLIEDHVHYLLTDHLLNSPSKVVNQFENASKFGSVTLEACSLQKRFRNELQSESYGSSNVQELDREVGLHKVIVNGDCASKLQEPGRSSRKHKHSRWDLKQGGETPPTDGTIKRRKTRWENNDSQNFLFQTSGFVSSLELSTDTKILSLKKRLIEINKILQGGEIYGNRTAEEISCSPKPSYNNLGISISKRVQKKLTKERQSILSQLALTFKNPNKFIKKIFVPVKEYPTYNFVGLILGPRGNTQKKMEKETGAKILLRGKGSGTPDEEEPLHVLVEADNQKALGAAADMIEKLLIPVADQNNDHKRAQLVELAKLRGTYKDNNICDLCKEQGHRQYACPLKDSTFKTTCCDICGSFGHSTSKCKSKDKSNKEVDNTNLYVGYLSHATDEKRLKELFSPFGKIIKTTVIKDQTTGLSKGYGFIKFDNPSDAAAAVKYMNGYKMDSKVLAVRVAGQKSVPDPLPPAVPSVNSCQTSYIFDPVTSITPQAPVSTTNKESLYFPFSSGNVARTVDIPPYVVPSTIKPMVISNHPSGHEFKSLIPSLLPTFSQFPGNPDYVSQFKSNFTSPLNEFQTPHFSHKP